MLVCRFLFFTGHNRTLVAAGCNRAVTKRFKVDLEGLLLDKDVVVIMRFARLPLTVTPTYARQPRNLEITFNKNKILEQVREDSHSRVLSASWW